MMASLTSRLAASCVFAASLGMLAAAYIAQYGFGLEPCILCLYQRVPYGATALIGAVAMWPTMPERSRLALLTLAGAVFLGEAGLAFYHVGVEQHWWAAVTACGGEAGGGLPQSITDLRRQMTAPSVVPCDQPAWQLFGLSMAGYNLLASLGLGLATFAAVLRLRRQKAGG